MYGLKYERTILKRSTGAKFENMEGAGSTLKSEKIEVPGDMLWGIQVISSMDGSPTMTINHSIDGLNYVPYSETTENIDLTKNFNQIKVDDHCIAAYLEFVFDFSTATNGTFTVYFLTKERL